MGHMNCRSHVLDSNAKKAHAFYIQKDGSMLIGEQTLNSNTYCEVKIEHITRCLNSISTYRSWVFIRSIKCVWFDKGEFHMICTWHS